MGSMMDGGVKPAVAKSLGADLQGRAQGSTGLANLIAAGSIRPDVFISVTPGPMRSVLKAGKAERAIPIAHTAMVIAYSPKSQYAPLFAKADDPDAKPWWQILKTPGLRFGRTDPNADPQGLNIIFMVQLAASYYHQPDLVDRILGPQINPQQIFSGIRSDGTPASRTTRCQFRLRDPACRSRSAVYLSAKGNQPGRRLHGKSI
jgi:molybdate/tungstate transport system substrate-binding protein